MADKPEDEQAEAEAGTEVEAGAGAGAGAGAEVETEVGAETEAGAETEGHDEAEAQADDEAVEQELEDKMAQMVHVGKVMMRGIEMYKVFKGAKPPELRIMWTDVEQTTLFTALEKNTMKHLKEFPFTAIKEFRPSNPSKFVSKEKTDKRFILETHEGKTLEVYVDTQKSRDILVSTLMRLVLHHREGTDSTVQLAGFLEQKLETNVRWVKRYFTIDGTQLKAYHSPLQLRLTARAESTANTHSSNHLKDKYNLALLQTVFYCPDDKNSIFVRLMDETFKLRATGETKLEEWFEKLECFVSPLFADTRAASVKERRRGWLWKSQGGSWKRRFFVLSDCKGENSAAELLYFDNEGSSESAEPKGRVALTAATIVAPSVADPARTLQLTFPARSKAGEGTLLLHAELPSECVAWFQLLQQLVDRLEADTNISSAASTQSQASALV